MNKKISMSVHFNKLKQCMRKEKKKEALFYEEILVL